jgi:hypothetical protein
MSALYSLPCSMQVIRSRVPRLSTVPTGSALLRRVQITVCRSCASIKRTSNSMSTSRSAVADARTLASVVVRTMSHGSEAPPVDCRPDPDLGGVGFPGPLPAISHLIEKWTGQPQPIAVRFAAKRPIRGFGAQISLGVRVAKMLGTSRAKKRSICPRQGVRGPCI